MWLRSSSILIETSFNLLIRKKLGRIGINSSATNYNNKAIFYKVYVRHFVDPETIAIIDPKGKYNYSEQFTLPFNTSQTVSHAVMIDEDINNLNTWQILWHGITGEYLSFDISDIILDAASIPDNATTYLGKLSKLGRKGWNTANYKYEKWPDTKTPYFRIAAFGTLLKIARDLNGGKLEPQDQIDLATVILQHILSNEKIREKVIYQFEKKLGKIVAQKLARKLLAFFAQIDWFIKIPGQTGIAWDIWEPSDWSDARHTDIVKLTICGKEKETINGDVWNLAHDFLVSPKQSNPNGAWSFMESTSLNNDPKTYRLLREFITDAFHIQNLQAWQGSDISIDIKDKLPKVGINNTGAFQKIINIGWDKGTILVHPAANKLVIIAWKSPLKKQINISGTISDIDSGGGDGITWSIEKGNSTKGNSTKVNEPLESGSLNNGGTKNFNLYNIAVDKGDIIYFVINPKNNHYYDSTGVDITIN